MRHAKEEAGPAIVRLSGVMDTGNGDTAAG